jgi:hypothetical protein
VKIKAAYRSEKNRRNRGGSLRAQTLALRRWRSSSGGESVAASKIGGHRQKLVAAKGGVGKQQLSWRRLALMAGDGQPARK